MKFIGDYGEVGFNLGRTFASNLTKDAEDCISNLPTKFYYDDVRSFVGTSHRAILDNLPDIYEEMVGVAEGAGIPIDIFILMACEELWDYESIPNINEKCTDMIASGPATRDGLTYSAHTNDEGLGIRPSLNFIHSGNDIPFHGFSTDGYFLSWACNQRGLVFSGNAITTDDIKPGIPRLVLFRAGIRSGSPLGALDTFTHPSRCTSYNNVVVDANGHAWCREASSTEAVNVTMENGLYAHTNHFLDLTEHDVKDNYLSSHYRLHTAYSEMLKNYGLIDRSILTNIIKDHGFTGYDGICRHSHDVVTKFSTVVCPQTKDLWYSFGSPCTTSWDHMKYY